MNKTLRARVWKRAKSICEYCRMPQSFDALSFEIDHIIAEKHHGSTQAANLALACFPCNNHKGPNIAGIDPETEETVSLFHPRRQRWSTHFQWDGPRLIGRTPDGRATVDVLAFNLPHRVAHREALIDEGVFPPR